MEKNDKPKISATAVVISAVLAAIIAGGGVYVYQSNKAKRDLEALKSQISVLQSEKAKLEKQAAGKVSTTAQSSTATSITAGETPEWKTLKATTNFDNGNPISYSVKYPADWEVKTDATKNKSLFLTLYFSTGSGGVSWDFDKQEDQTVNLGSHRFTERAWTKDNEITVISYLVEDYLRHLKLLLSRCWLKTIALM